MAIAYLQWKLSYNLLSYNLVLLRWETDLQNATIPCFVWDIIVTLITQVKGNKSRVHDSNGTTDSGEAAQAPD